MLFVQRPIKSFDYEFLVYFSASITDNSLYHSERFLFTYTNRCVITYNGILVARICQVAAMKLLRLITKKKKKHIEKLLQS